MKILYLELIGYKRFMLNQIDYFEMVINKPTQIILGSNGSGKFQPLDALIKTPGGWLKMGQMEIGTEVIAKDGTATKVTGVYPHGMKEIFKITFADGRSTECGADHLWRVYTGGKQYPIVPQVINTMEIMRLLDTKTYGNLLWVDLIDSEQNADIELPIDPYLLGVFLGDGCSRGSPDITTPDTFIVNEVSKLLPPECMLSEGHSCRVNKEGGESCYTYGIKRKPNAKVNTFTKALINLDIFGKLSYDKFIPEIYLHASTKQRLHLLQGLLDTDGTIGTKGSVSFSSSSEKLALGVQYLVRSLGGIAKLSIRIPHYTYLGQRLTGRLDFRVNIRYKKQSELFRLPKKKERTNDYNQYAAILKNKIETVESIGFKEVQCISIEHPDHLYVTDQFIVTHNSSLLQQLTPLPANQADFIKTGSKVITISHNNSIYNLKSIFSPSQKHSFIKDDVELNDGGTITIQKELVRTHFKITPDTHSLLLGDECFDTMSPNRRKEWFVLLCDTNYEYAINVYNKVKDRHRDVIGALKIAKKKLVAETEKTIKTDDEIKLKDDVHTLHNNLLLLLELRKPVEDDIDVLGFQQDELDVNIAKCANMLNDILKKSSRTISTDSCIASINHANDKINLSQSLIGKYTTEYNANQEKIVILQKAERQTIESLQCKLDRKVVRKTNVKNRLIFVSKDYDSLSAMNAFLSVKDSLISIFSSIPNNANRKYSNEKLTSARTILNDEALKKSKYTTKLIECIAKQKHMVDHKDKPDINCPKCNYKFSLQYNEEAHMNIQIEIKELEDYLDIISSNIKKQETYIEECTQYSMLYRQYTNCINNYSILKQYWSYINSKSIITDNPQYGITEIGVIEADLKDQILYTNLCKDCAEIETLLASLKDVGGVDLKTLLEINDGLKASIEESTKSLQFYSKYKKEYTDLLARNRDIQNLCDKIQEYMDKKYSICKEAIESTRRSIFNDTIKTLQSELATKEHILSSIKSQKSIIENTILNISELESEEIALGLLVKQLSPVDGLIAEGLFGFIKGFIKQMNTLISKVWTYPMEVKLCGLTDDNTVDLDYKFPIQLTNGDVPKGSKGMVEMINFAFKVIALKYLGLQNAPLIMDELASSMDNAHKQGIINLIKAMVEQNMFTQLFMVSHDFSQYSAMLNVDTCVLCPNNIVLPEHYNENVKLSR